MPTVLGKYRKEVLEPPEKKTTHVSKEPTKTKVTAKKRGRKPIPDKRVIFTCSIESDLLECLKTISKEQFLNLSRWTEQKLIQAVIREFPEYAEKYGIKK